MHPPGPYPIGDTRGLHNGRVRAHVVDDPYKAIIEHLERLPKDLIECKDVWTF